MEDTEALMFYSLDSIFLDVLPDEFVWSFICWDRVGEVVCINLFLWIADERANCFYAGRRLKVLILDLGVKKTSKSVKLRESEFLAEADKNLLETLHIPVLVDRSVDDVRSKNLLSFMRQKEHKIVNRVDLFVVVFILAAEFRENLLTQKTNGWHEGLTEVLVLLGVEHAALNFVDEWAWNWDDESVFNLWHLRFQILLNNNNGGLA